MADQTPHELAEELGAPIPAALLVAQRDSAAQRMSSLPMGIVGAQAIAAASGDANVAGLEFTHHRADLTALTQARDYLTPATCREGARVSLSITTANGSGHGLRVLNRAGQTINGADFSSAPFVTLDGAGQIVSLRCTVADTAFELEAAALTVPGAYLRTDAAAAIDADHGYYAAAARAISGTLTIEPSAGQYWHAAGAFTLNLQSEIGTSVGFVPNGTSASLPGYTEIGTQPGTGDAVLILCRPHTAAFGTATWLGSA